mmetsp:Transcript_16951/g.30757  ORF Transcript_16951/g.30757 Transcript_16951/m.30757 type:complete len:112 (-) Transcript_16951:2058-2393(-)
MMVYFPVINSIQKHRHGLSHEAKRDPENYIANGASRESPINHFGQEYQWYLSHHCKETMYTYHMARHTYQHFMQNSRKEEDYKCSTSLGEAEPDRRKVDMTYEPIVNWHIP